MRLTTAFLSSSRAQGGGGGHVHLISVLYSFFFFFWLIIWIVEREYSLFKTFDLIFLSHGLICIIFFFLLASFGLSDEKMVRYETKTI